MWNRTSSAALAIRCGLLSTTLLLSIYLVLQSSNSKPDRLEILGGRMHSIPLNVDDLKAQNEDWMKISRWNEFSKGKDQSRARGNVHIDHVEMRKLPDLLQLSLNRQQSASRHRFTYNSLHNMHPRLTRLRAGNFFHTRVSDIPDDMIEALDFAVDPCDDFYGFACGSFRDPVNTNSQDWSFSEARATARNFTMGLLQKDDGEAGVFYRSCLNTNSTEEQGISPLRELLTPISRVQDSKSLTDYLVIPESLFAKCFQATHLNSQVTIGERRKQAFFSWSVTAGVTGLHTKTVVLSPGPVTLPDSMYSDISDRPRQATDGNHVVGVEAALAAAVQGGEASRRPVVINVSQLVSLCPSVLWPDLLGGLGWGGDGQSWDTEPASPGRTLAVTNIDFFSKLETGVFSSLSWASLRSYLRWRIILDYSPYLPVAFGDLLSNLDSYRRKSEVSPSLSIRCFHLVEQALPGKVSNLYLEGVNRSEWEEDTKEVALEMMQQLRGALVEDLARTDWLDSAALNSSRDFLTNLGYSEGRPTEADLDLAEDSLLRNAINVDVVTCLQEREALFLPGKLGEWSRAATTVRPWYDSNLNTLFVPAAFLRPPLYSKAYPLARNYGSAGIVASTALANAVFSEGRTNEQYAGRAACVAEFFSAVSKYQHETPENDNSMKQFIFVEESDSNDINDNSTANLTADSASALVGGLKAAYVALQAATKAASEDLSGWAGGSGVSDVESRIFFLAFAQTQCGAGRRLNRFMVNGALAEIESYSDVFKCPLGSPMRPAQKNQQCNVW